MILLKLYKLRLRARPHLSLVRLCVHQALLEFLSKVVSREKRNRMNLWAVATIMAPNLFLHKAVPSRLTEGSEKGQAEKAADVMRLLIRYQDLLWTVGDGGWMCERSDSKRTDVISPPSWE